MSTPYQTNTTCDIYRSANAPPAAPDVAGVAIVLQPDFAHAHAVGLTLAPSSQQIPLRWTHVALMALDTDVRDGYGATPDKEPVPSGWDHCYVPDQNGTKFDVVFVERIGRNGAQDLLRVYLVRGTPAWPTSQL